MSWCILVNTTPKYMHYAEVQIACLRRYALKLDSVPIYIATEERPTHGSCLQRILRNKNTHHISLQQEESGFLESRLSGITYLPDNYDFVLPLQEDFWLDRAPDYKVINDAINILVADMRIQCVRLMPSPGPHPEDEFYKDDWLILGIKDEYKFTFQATLWRRDSYIKFMEHILKIASKDFHSSGLPSTDWSKYCVRVNVAENLKGQKTFSEMCMGPNKLHLSIKRSHDSPNAVFLAPWPYRPTAVVQGSLEPWAKEFAKREGFKLN